MRDGRASDRLADLRFWGGKDYPFIIKELQPNNHYELLLF
jgi:hypothetical protein